MGDASVQFLSDTIDYRLFNIQELHYDKLDSERGPHMQEHAPCARALPHMQSIHFRSGRCRLGNFQQFKLFRHPLPTGTIDVPV